MKWFEKSEKASYFHVVFSATFEKGTKFVSAEMEVNGAGIIQAHILESWRSVIMKEVGCTNAIILNFIEIDKLK